MRNCARVCEIRHYWLVLGLRDAVPALQPLAAAEFSTVRLRMVKLGACIRETASRVRVAFASACPDADLIRGIVRGFCPSGP